MDSPRSIPTIRLPDDTEVYEFVDAPTGTTTTGHNRPVEPGRGYAGAVLGTGAGTAAPASVLSELGPSVFRMPPADDRNRTGGSDRRPRTWTPIMQAILEEDMRDATNAPLPRSPLPSIGTTMATATVTASSSRQTTTTPAMTIAAAAAAAAAKNTQWRRQGVWTCCKCEHLNAAFETACLRCRTFVQTIHLRCTDCGGFSEDPDPDTSRYGGSGGGGGAAVGKESDNDDQAQDGFVVIYAFDTPAE